MYGSSTIFLRLLLSLFFLFFALLFAAFFVIAATWDTPYRLHVVGGLTLLFLLCAGILWGMVRAKFHSKPRLFQASLAELYKDRQQLSSE